MLSEPTLAKSELIQLAWFVRVIGKLPAAESTWRLFRLPSTSRSECRYFFTSQRVGGIADMNIKKRPPPRARLSVNDDVPGRVKEQRLERRGARFFFPGYPQHQLCDAV